MARQRVTDAWWTPLSVSELQATQSLYSPMTSGIETFLIQMAHSLLRPLNTGEMSAQSSHTTDERRAMAPARDSRARTEYASMKDESINASYSGVMQYLTRRRDPSHQAMFSAKSDRDRPVKQKGGKKRKLLHLALKPKQHPYRTFTNKAACHHSKQV